jgi:hypothetical protein
MIINESKVSGETNFIGQNFAAIVANNFQDLLDLLDEARMVHRLGQLNMTEVAGTLPHSLRACLALELPVDGTKKWVIEAAIARLGFILLHRLRIENMRDTHVLDFLWRHETELNLLHRLERRARVGEVEVRHLAKFALSRP